MTLLKNIVLWDGSPPRSAGVPNLFGVSPQRGQFADQNAPNELGSPTEDAFFNRTFDTLRYSIGARSGGYRQESVKVLFHSLETMPERLNRLSCEEGLGIGH